MKTARKNRDKNRENALVVPMNKEEKERVRSRANEMGVSMSAFARIVLNDFMKNAKK